MPLRSMTGFGEAASTIEGVHYFLEIRSLNSRYFKATIRLPDVFRPQYRGCGGTAPTVAASLKAPLRHW